MIEFTPFAKMARLNREIIITEKIDGTNASIYIGESGEFLVGSRNKWITPDNDNFGFARWAYTNQEELMKLGVGHHFGEWWGKGIQRNYAMTEKVFSLFNVGKWNEENKPSCCRVVPTLYIGLMEDHGVCKGVQHALKTLTSNGSVAAPGFMDPEGIVIYHTASRMLFKKTLKDDEIPKSLVK